MKYIIDGYNVIGKFTEIDLSDKQKEEKLLTKLASLNWKKNDKVILVFDGKRAFDTIGQKQKCGNILMVITPTDLTADDYIIQKIENAEHKDAIIVISSDRDVQRAAKRNRSHVMSSEGFLKFITKLTAPSTKTEPLYTNTEYWLNEFNKNND